MQLNAEKTKFFCFHETTQARNARNNHDKLMASLFGQRHSTSYPCTQTTPNPLTGLTVTQLCIQTPARGKAIWLSWPPTRPHCEYESCCVIHPRKGKQSSLSSLSLIPSAMTSTNPNPTICSSPVTVNCLAFGNPVSFHSSSSTSATYQMRHKLRHYRLASTSHSAPPCMFMDIPQHSVALSDQWTKQLLRIFCPELIRIN